MYLGLRKIILLIIVFSFCSLSLLGKEKNMNFAIGVETRNFIMTGITTEFNYERFKVGGYFSYWHNHQSEKALSAEAFLALGLYKGDIYSFYIKGLIGKEAYLWEKYKVYPKHLGAGVKNEWNLGVGKIIFDIDLFFGGDYYNPNEEGDQIGGLLGFKLGYLFYF